MNAAGTDPLIPAIGREKLSSVVADHSVASRSHPAARTYALAGLILVMFVWGITYVVTKAAVREIPPLTLAFLRYLIASAVLIPLALARGRHRAPAVSVVPLALMGLTGIAILTIGFNYGLLYGSASQGALVYSLSPAAVALAAVLGLHESLSSRRILGITLSVAGSVIVVASGETGPTAPRPLLGALCMLAGVLAWAYYTVIAKRLARADQVVVIAWVTVLGTAMLLPFAAVELTQGPLPRITTEGWLATLFLGAAASAGAYLGYSLVLRELDASLVGAWFPLDPIVGVVSAVVFLGEALRGGQIVGGVIALAGMWLAASNRGGHGP
jgi:drug/metabolite transporter (DMT)-like permease